MKKINKLFAVGAGLVLMAGTTLAHVGDYARHLAERYAAAEKEAGMVRLRGSGGDFAMGVTGSMPGWTGCPVKKAFLEEGQEPSEFEMAVAKDPQGYSPRNIAMNAALPLGHPLRHVTPDFANTAHSLYEEDGVTVRQAVIDALTIKLYKEETLPHWGLSAINYSGTPASWDQEREDYFIHVMSVMAENHPFASEGDPLGQEKAKELIAKYGITYDRLFLADLVSGKTPENRTYDAQGRLYTENPLAPRMNVTGKGFYFADGENGAIDVTIRVKHQGRTYYLAMQRTDTQTKQTKDEDGSPIVMACTGGMPDKFEPAARNVVKELTEEVGILFDWERLKATGKMQKVLQGFVAAEPRQTATSGSVTEAYLMDFDSLEEMLSFGRYNGDVFDSKESLGGFFVEENFLLNRMMNPDKKFFASHRSIFEIILGKIFSENPSALGEIAGREVGPWEASHLPLEALREAFSA